MKSKARDKSGGTLDKARGRAREAAAALKGNPEGKTKGQARQARARRGRRKVTCATCSSVDPRAGSI